MVVGCFSAPVLFFRARIFRSFRGLRLVRNGKHGFCDQPQALHTGHAAFFNALFVDQTFGRERSGLSTYEAFPIIPWLIKKTKMGHTAL